MYFLTGNADDGTFSIAEKTVCERCGMTEETYKKARKALIAKRWISHEDGKIVVNYDEIYKTIGDTGDTLLGDTQHPKKGEPQYPYNKGIEKYNITNTAPKDEPEGFVF